METSKLMTPLFCNGMFNADGKRKRAVFVGEVSNGTDAYRLWRSCGAPNRDYPRAENDTHCRPLCHQPAIQNRLDESVGSENWYNSYKPWHGREKRRPSFAASPSTLKGAASSPNGMAPRTQTSSRSRGGLSDSMKRAAVQWGIGRVLYSLNDTVWVDIEKKGRSFIIPDSERSKLDKVYLNLLSRLGLTPAPPCGAKAQLTPTPPTENPQAGYTPTSLSRPRKRPDSRKQQPRRSLTMWWTFPSRRMSMSWRAPMSRTV